MGTRTPSLSLSSQAEFDTSRVPSPPPSLVEVDGHTFDAGRLRPGGWALDAGCRGFRLARYLAARGVRVLAVDADPDVADSHIPGVTFVNAVLCAAGEMPPDGWATLYRWHSSPEAHTTRWGPPETGVRVPARTVAQLMREHGVPWFELVKLDVEGSEYGILEELTEPGSAGPVAGQISVEYHDFCHMSPTPDDPELWHGRNLAQLRRRGYDVVRHAKQPAPWGGGEAYMDCLYVLSQLRHWRGHPSRKA